MPAQFYLLSISINTYSACIALAVMTGIVVLLWHTHWNWQTLSSKLDGLLIVSMMSVALGRLGYILLNLTYFQEHANEILTLSSPGLMEQMAILGGLLGYAISQRLGKDMPAGWYLVLATLIGVSASVGCIPVGCAYGREVFWTDGWLWLLRADWPDATMINNPRLPTQIFEIIWLIAGLGIVAFARARDWRVSHAGWGLALWALLFASGDFAIQFARAEPMPIVAGLRVSQWVDIILVICCFVLLALGFKSGKTGPNSRVM